MTKTTSHRSSLWILILLTLCFFHFTETAAGQQMFRAGTAMSPQLDVKMQSAALEYVNPEYIGKDAFLKIRRLSRDTPVVLMGFFPLLKDWPLEITYTYTAYRKMSNRWAESFIKGADQLCNVLESKIPYHREFFRYWSFPSKCPVCKGNVTIDNFFIKFSKVPNIGGLTANQEWKVKLGFLTLEDPVLTFSYELRLDPAKAARQSQPPRHHN